MLENFRHRMFQKALLRKKTGLKRDVVNKSFDDSSSFLILFDGTSEDRYNQFTRIYSTLQLKGKTVQAIGFHGMPANPLYCIQSLHVEIMGKADINKNGIPLSKTIEEVLQKPFDVLIDLTRCMIPAMRWITILSAARFKIGVSAKNCPHLYDLTIESETVTSQEEIMQLAVKYLNMLKNKTI